MEDETEHETYDALSPGPGERTVCDARGNVLDVPADWDLLPPGDAGLTRRVKSLGPTWTVKEKKGRRTFSLGVWAAKEQIESARREIAETRSTDAYKKRLAADKKRRDERQGDYVQDFRQAILDFLNFHPTHRTLAATMATRIADHATPVGSGTVARTKRIPIERRAAAAVIAWMRHATTEYDDMKIRRVKGERRAVRRELAERSKKLLDRYRRGDATPTASCVLTAAVTRKEATRDSDARRADARRADDSEG